LKEVRIENKELQSIIDELVPYKVNNVHTGAGYAPFQLPAGQFITRKSDPHGYYELTII